MDWNLSSICIDARFDRKQFTQRPQYTQSHIPTKVAYGMKHTDHANRNRSYATAVKGNSDNLKAQSDKVLMKKIALNQSNLLVIPDTSCVVLAKYVGGLWLWLEFNSKDACLNFKQHNEVEWYFTQIQHVSKTFKVDVVPNSRSIL
ncbi:hypothetical protein Tco_0086971 [Tanacetum coccineum]